MVEYETVKSSEFGLEDDKFIQIARKKRLSGDGAETLISFAQGYIGDEGDRRVKANFSVPADEDVVKFLLAELPEMLDSE